jgi:uncharacterized protein (TIGR02099 family)
LSQRGSNKPARRLGTLLRRLRQWLAAIAAVAIIATAVVVGVGRMLIPYADELRPWLESQLSERLGQPVSIERVEARWPRLTPQVTLQGLRAGDERQPLIEAARARLELHLPDLLRAERNPFRLVVLGLDLVLAENESGQWGLRMQGDGQPAGGGQGLAGDLLVRDARLRVRPRAGPPLDVIIEEGEIRRLGDRTGLVARAHLAAAPRAALDLALAGRQVDGRLQALTGRVSLDRLRLAAIELDDFLPGFLTVPPDRLGASLRFDWRAGRGGVADLELELSGEGDFEASARLRIERRARRIDAELETLTVRGQPIAEGIVLAHRDERWAASVPALDLPGVHALLGRWLGDWEHWPTSVAGRIDGLELLYRHPGSLHRLEGAITGLAFDLPGDRAGLSGLDLDLGLAGDRAALSLSGSPVLDWPAKMRQPVPIETISGRLVVSPRAVQIDGVVGRRPEASARADGWVWLGGGRPFMDFIVTSDRVGPVDPRPWLPAGQIPPKALTWLDRALLGVTSASGGLNYHFRLGHKFRTWSPGDFQAWVDFRGADLDYWEDWPVARDLGGRIDFAGRSMVASVDAGRLGTVPLTAERIAIDDLTAPAVEIELAAESVESAAVRDVVGAFPIEGWSRFVEPVAASGTLSLETDLFLPVRSMSDWRLQGRVTLDGTTLALPAAALRFPELKGPLAFDREGIDPTRLTIGAEGQAAVEVAAGFTRPNWLEASGRLLVSRLLSGQAPWSELAGRIGGESEWRVRLDGHPAGGWQLDARSDLAGLSLQLPVPLTKPAESVMPLQLSLRGHEAGLTVSGRLGELLDLTAEDASGRWRLAAGLGRAAPALPSTAGFEIAGAIDRLDLAAWIDLLSALSPARADAGGTGGGRLRLQLGRLDYGAVSLLDVELDGRRDAQEWRLNLAGDNASGEVSVPRPIDSGRVVAVDMARLHLARPEGESLAEDLSQAPVPGQTSTRVPTEFPPIHLLVESFRYGELPMGRVRVESHARPDGIEIERIEVDGPHLELGGHGRWIVGADGPVTEFEGRLISSDLPALLDAMGHASQFRAARAQVDLNGRWTGAPFDFALARLSGRMQLVMVDGNIPEAQPGAGRLLGLISLSAMPRRLMLDFRDVFGQGLKFDRIEGAFELAGGVARTDGLKLESPAADIRVSGLTDLGGQTYDQTVVVEPGVGGTLPVLGGLAGGPAGAAAGLILRSLLERPLQGIAEARYRVTGPWGDPEVELVGARAAEPDYRLDAGEENGDAGEGEPGAAEENDASQPPPD